MNNTIKNEYLILKREILKWSEPYMNPNEMSGLNHKWMLEVYYNFNEETWKTSYINLKQIEIRLEYIQGEYLNNLPYELENPLDVKMLKRIFKFIEENRKLSEAWMDMLFWLKKKMPRYSYIVTRMDSLDYMMDKLEDLLQ